MPPHTGHVTWFVPLQVEHLSPLCDGHLTVLLPKHLMQTATILLCS